MSRLVIKDVPPDELEQVVADFKSENMKVTTIPEDDGQWTVIAVPNDNFRLSALAGNLVGGSLDDGVRLQGKLRFDRPKFFAAYEKAFGSLTLQQRDGLNTLFQRLEDDPRVSDLRICAYILATVKWETAHTFQPINEFGDDDYFNQRYGPLTKVGKRLGNVKKGDGARFHGRGYVQLTGRNNYAAFGLEKTPEKALDPVEAYQILVGGMLGGSFGARLGQFIVAGQPADYDAARRSVNGTDHAGEIGTIATQIESMLGASQKN
jgi:hypothetical protein